MNASWLAALFLSLVGTSAMSAEIIAIHAGAVIDPDTATASTNQTILIEDGKIKAIGNNVTVPPGATVVD